MYFECCCESSSYDCVNNQANSKPKEDLERYQVATSNTFARPGAVVIRFLHTVVTVMTMLCQNVLTSYQFAPIAIKMDPKK